MAAMTNSEFQHIVKTIPRNPGIYKYYNEKNELLYVGKAKDLRKRVSSYFLKNLTSYKTHELVNRIHHIEFTIVNSEQDAFFLENSLIKNFQPRFNINLKDDKSYPYIVIKNEPFPRVFLTRKHIEDGSEYLGPLYISASGKRAFRVYQANDSYQNLCLKPYTKKYRTKEI
jgi:excinuclease ABC subunit C